MDNIKIDYKITKQEMEDYALIQSNHFLQKLGEGFRWKKNEYMNKGDGYNYGNYGKTKLKKYEFYYFGMGKYRRDYTGYFLAKDEDRVPDCWAEDETNIFNNNKYKIAQEFYRFLKEIRKKIKSMNN